MRDYRVEINVKPAALLDNRNKGTIFSTGTKNLEDAISSINENFFRDKIGTHERIELVKEHKTRRRVRGY